MHIVKYYFGEDEVTSWVKSNKIVLRNFRCDHGVTLYCNNAIFNTEQDFDDFIQLYYSETDTIKRTYTDDEMSLIQGVRKEVYFSDGRKNGGSFYPWYIPKKWTNKYIEEWLVRWIKEWIM